MVSTYALDESNIGIHAARMARASVDLNLAFKSHLNLFVKECKDVFAYVYINMQ